ncbi:hypothetical protein [Comamonas sp.]
MRDSTQPAAPAWCRRLLFFIAGSAYGERISVFFDTEVLVCKALAAHF